MGEPRPVHLTWHDFEALPEDGRRYELHDGRLEVTPAPSERHQTVVLNLAALLRDWVRTRQLGKVLIAPFDVVLACDTIVEPDLVFFARDRLGLLDGRKANGAPDLAVEVFHHAGALKDTEIKRQLYARYGVREYWLVDLDLGRVTVLSLTPTGYEQHQRAGQGERLTSSILPGFEVDWSELFRED